MAADRTGPHPWGIVAVALIGLISVALPEGLRYRLQGAIRDLLAPGQCVVASLSADNAPVNNDDWERQARFWQAQAATLRTELAATRDVPLWTTATRPAALISPTLRQATVIAWEHPGQSETPLPIVRGGTSDGIAISDLVLAPGTSTIDQGTTTGIAADQLLLAGRTVIGRVAQASRLTSTIERVTDAKYRGQAQIVRIIDNEVVLGAEGVIAGTGTGCQLLHVDGTEPVSVGDLVFTPVHGVALSAPLYYGIITDAELEAGASEWSITVAPRFTGDPPGKVLVLELRAAPQRTQEQLAEQEAGHVR